MEFLKQTPDLLIIGLIFMIGWVAHIIGSKTHIPRVTLLLATGVVAGPTVFDVVPSNISEQLPTISHLALAMVGFLLGESFARKDDSTAKKQVFLISLGASLIPAIFVLIGTYLLTTDIILAMLLAGIATATDPAATIDVIKETKAKGPMVNTLKSVVAIDDAWGVIIFSCLLVIAMLVSGNGNGVNDFVHGSWELVGAVVLGIVIGIPMAKIVGRYTPGEPTIVEAMGFVFICGGIAQLIGVSYLLACMAMGATVTRRAKHVNRPFHAIEKVSDPFLIVFFLISGVSLNINSAEAIGVIGATYIVARTLGKILGAHWFSKMAAASPEVSKKLGWCLLPQAGVAIGMALLVGNKFPEYEHLVLTIAVTSTVLFELLGPLVARRQLEKS